MAAYTGLKMKVVAETPAHKQGNRLQMKLDLRHKRLSLDPSNAIAVAESPVKYDSDGQLTAEHGNYSRGCLCPQLQMFTPVPRFFF